MTADLHDFTSSADLLNFLEELGEALENCKPHDNVFVVLPDDMAEDFKRFLARVAVKTTAIARKRWRTA